MSPGEILGAMKGTLTESNKTAPATAPGIGQALSGGQFFWLDIDTQGSGLDGDLTALLTDIFHFHPVAVHAAEHFGQRARIDDFGDFVQVVTFGMAADSTNVAEVHCFISDKFIVSIHQGDCPALSGVRDQLGTHHASDAAAPQIVVFYLIMDTLIDSFFPVLSDLDDAIDDLESAILKNPTEQQLGTLFDMKRRIMTIRKVITPQRDMISTLNAGMVQIPGMTDQGSVYFRSLYDHLIRISDMVDSYRDLVSGATDTHLSMVSNRLNIVMKQLAIIATVFLPLSFLTGFFGQNFSWLVVHAETGIKYFVFLGIGSEVVAIVLLLWLFKRRGWMGAGPTA
ncbi:MAG: magnesium transporter CorA family protein [Acidimicrobiales bacterium]